MSPELHLGSNCGQALGKKEERGNSDWLGVKSAEMCKHNQPNSPPLPGQSGWNQPPLFLQSHSFQAPPGPLRAALLTRLGCLISLERRFRRWASLHSPSQPTSSVDQSRILHTWTLSVQTHLSPGTTAAAGILA